MLKMRERYSFGRASNITNANHYAYRRYIVIIIIYEAQSVVNYRLIVSRVVPGEHA